MIRRALKFLLAALCLANTALSQGYDTWGAVADTRADSVRRNRIELGFNTMGVGAEYRYQLLPFLGADAVLSESHPGIAAGLTVNPVSFVFFQGVIGKPWFKEEPAADGPPGFSPNYTYGWRVGVHFPIDPGANRFYVVLSAGRMTLVQTKYQYSGGGFIVGPPIPPEYRKEIRYEDVFAVSLGIKI